jgi:hypothetical protein
LNELLGGPDAGENEGPARLPKTEAGKSERAPENFQLDVTEATVSVAGTLTTSINASEADQRSARDVRARLKE